MQCKPHYFDFMFQNDLDAYFYYKFRISLVTDYIRIYYIRTTGILVEIILKYILVFVRTDILIRFMLPNQKDSTFHNLIFSLIFLNNICNF